MERAKTIESQRELAAHEEEQPSKRQPLVVAMFIQHYHPFVGGAERQLQALTSSFQHIGVRTVVITRRLAGPEFTPRETVAGALVFRVALRGGHVLRSVTYTLGALQTIWGYRRQIDVLHAHELLSPTTTAVLAKLLIRRPVVAKVLGGGSMGDVPKLLSKPLGHLRMRIFKRLVDRFICVSSEIAEQLRAVGVPESKLIRITNGVNSAMYLPAEAGDQLAARAALGLARGPMVLFSGRLAPEKGLRTLSTAWRTVQATHPDAQLVIVGEGPEREFLESSATPGMRLVGKQTNVRDYLRAADVFVLPSQLEGLSNALLEAMSTALACVATPVGGTTELIANEQTGLLAAYGQSDVLATALSRALDDEQLRARLGSAARAFVVEHYSLETTAQALASLYHSLTPRMRARTA